MILVLCRAFLRCHACQSFQAQALQARLDKVMQYVPPKHHETLMKTDVPLPDLASSCSALSRILKSPEAIKRDLADMQNNQTTYLH